MPSECNEPFGSEGSSYEDLNSPDSLYPKDSVNNLLPQELRIPDIKSGVVIYQAMTLKSDRSLEANLDQPSYLSSTTTTFPAFENNQHGLGVLDSTDMNPQSKGLGVSNEVVSELSLLSSVSEAPVGLFQFSEFSDIGSSTSSSAVTSPAPSSPLMSIDSYLQSPLDVMDENSIQELMNVNEDSLVSMADIELEQPTPRKCRKNSKDQSPSSPLPSEDSVSFDADGAVASPKNFNFSEQADWESSIIRNVVAGTSSYDACIRSNPLGVRSRAADKTIMSPDNPSSNVSRSVGKPLPATDMYDSAGGESDFWDMLFSSLNRSNQELPMDVSVPVSPMKEPSLSAVYPQKENGVELKIIVQPETHHRARYQTEGSRGCVKDESQNGFPTVKLIGYDKKYNLQVFVGNDCGKVKPHGFYQASKVSGRNNTPSEEKEIDGTKVIEIQIDPSEDEQATIDCVGIMKLRNADVEHKGLHLPRSKKRSTRARLVFRVNIPKADGSFRTIQIASTPISCTQPTGLPEISKKSLSSCSVEGGEELFVLGKNFVRGTVVKFQQYSDEKVVWEEKAQLDREHFQQNHLVCRIPAYKKRDIREPVEVSVIISTGNGRDSDPQTFTYLPKTPAPVPVPAADASATKVKVKAERTEAPASCFSSVSSTAKDECMSIPHLRAELSNLAAAAAVSQTSTSQEAQGSQSSFAEQLKLVALLATGQTCKSNHAIAQRVLSVINQQKVSHQQQQQERLLKQQQSYIGVEKASPKKINEADNEAALDQLILQGIPGVDYDLDAILDTLQQVASEVALQ